MKNPYLRRVMAAMAVLVVGPLTLMTPLTSSAQSSDPSRVIRMIVPLPSGTATDLAARLLAQQMGATLGQTVVVDNKPGANGVIGMMDLVRSAPNGNTLLLGSQSPLAGNVALVKNLPYDPRKDLTPINGFGETFHALMVRPDHPAKTMPEFIAYARQKNGQVSIGSTTAATEIEIAAVTKATGVPLLTVPYKGIPATIVDVIGGTLDASFVDLANAMSQAQGGKLRPIAITALKRSPLVPTWPAMSETIPGYDIPSWVALVGPAGMQPDLVLKINAAVTKALNNPELKDKLATIGMTPMIMTPQEFGTLINNETVKWVRLAKEANMEPQ